MLGKTEGRRRREQQRMRWLNGTPDSMDMGLGGPRELVMDREVGCCGSWDSKELDMTERLKCTELIALPGILYSGRPPNLILDKLFWKVLAFNC